MTINYWAVLVSAILAMVVGYIWYGPLFGKKYLALMGMDSMTPEQKEGMKKGMIKSYIWQYVGSAVMFYVLAWVIGATNMTSVSGGLSTAFWVWLGFVVPVKFSDALWGGKMGLFWLGIGSLLVTLLLGGAIIGGWGVGATY